MRKEGNKNSLGNNSIPSHTCEYHGFWAQDPLLNRSSICTGPLPDSNPNMAQNSLLHHNHTGTIQAVNTYISSKAPSPLVGHPTPYRILIHGSLNSIHLKTIILNKGELVSDKKRKTFIAKFVILSLQESSRIGL